ncbi:hypothetical protein FA15DRAFT_678546 [Coprinopsis marcescibilis]|uniref:Uncharacterized protein n=1 Tax=Coprinopsis marcescibilis TaxID=230819 RepID=A0A5C3L6H0_COPMA|nr:hypothetical protein FA15DRAFT_678546 [Coprinopsis marcescibilis]
MSSCAGDDDDEHSLFGSPPPSPGRSPSPALALPSTRPVNAIASESGSNPSTITNLNVGTIALPGSQPSSELFVNPIAPHLAPPSASESLNPPPKIKSKKGKSASSSSSARSTPASSSTAASKPPKKRKSRATLDTSIPVPEFHLPDPSAPPPANFLRSQTALLGVAGLVGGVKPAQLKGKARGATPTNPIVVEDEPPQSRNYYSHPFAFTRHPPQPPKAPPKPKPPPKPRKDPMEILDTIDTSKVPMPSKKEILSVLVKEKDLLPVLHGLIKLGTGLDRQRPATGPRWSAPELQDLSQRLKGGAAQNVARSARSTPEAPEYPSKKRRLNRVPAGAADWDVPYPFSQGEGPEAYRETWTGHRGRQLIAQMVHLVKIATRKAALQKLIKGQSTGHSDKVSSKPEDDGLKRQHYYRSVIGGSRLSDEQKKYNEEPRVNKYYKPITATYGLNTQRGHPNGQSSTSTTPATTSPPAEQHVPDPVIAAPSTSSSTASTPAPEHYTQETESLDEFLQSLFAMTSNQNADQQSSTSEQTIGDIFSGVTDGAQTPNFDASEGLLDSWMRMLQGTTTGMSPTTLMSASTDFDPTQSASTTTTTTTPAVGDFDPMSFGDFDAFINSPLEENDASTMDFSGVDFNLLGLSMQQQQQQGESFAGSVTASSAASPNPSASTGSFAGGPLTPASGDWDMSVGVFDSMGVGAMDGGGFAVPSLGDGEGGGASEGFLDVWGVLDKVPPLETRRVGEVDVGVRLGGPRGEDVVQPQPTPTPTTMPLAQPDVQGPDVRPPRAAPSNPQPTTKSSTLQKEEAVKKVKDRKAQLEAELKKVKLQLWETTIEQAGLNHVLQHYQEKERQGLEVQGGQVLVAIDNTSS